MGCSTEFCHQYHHCKLKFNAGQTPHGTHICCNYAYMLYYSVHPGVTFKPWIYTDVGQTIKRLFIIIFPVISNLIPNLIACLPSTLCKYQCLLTDCCDGIQSSVAFLHYVTTVPLYPLLKACMIRFQQSSGCFEVHVTRGVCNPDSQSILAGMQTEARHVEVGWAV